MPTLQPSITIFISFIDDFLCPYNMYDAIMAMQLKAIDNIHTKKSCVNIKPAPKVYCRNNKIIASVFIASVAYRLSK